jgi:CheY-like chemotaxis protein
MAKVILVEDSKDQQDFLTAVLQADGHEVRVVHDGREALRTLAVESFDMVVTDIFMPDCDGIELIRDLRRHENRIPVIALTAGILGDSELYLRIAGSFGADLVLSKKQSPQDLAAAIRQVLCASEART